ncbi:glycoside hydrolase family 26 protein [Lutibacter sp. B1]|uniref:glycoside hydrolase family 26 protein n=1 Tax=Lutibacter sp. B1 TaxID=2725996 RepID=UPI001456DCE5|nr:glycosyl hydrolase [Lutibacter sp. B1]NLP57737.1 hypothetical protein [Lutibacter sp. B1]
MDKIFKSYNKIELKIIVLILLTFSFYSCKNLDKSNNISYKIVDKEASKNVKNLYDRLVTLSKNGFAIGHQDATSYGLGWNYEDNPNEIKSDVNDVVGDFPAVYGFDIGHIELAHSRNLDSVSFDVMRKLMVNAHKRGGIVTVSWHLDNPVTDGNSWDKTSAVSDILEGGSQRAKYELWVERVANFLNSVQYNGEVVPIIFRPFHEMNGFWFWWGDPNCSASDYVKLWQDTVKLLRDKHHVHNLLYAYSPNKLNPDDDYMKYYPGDDYVDILGIDIYDFNNSEDYVKSVIHDLEIVKKVAAEKNKLYAFTETGIEKIQTPNWFTEVVYPAIENSGISWILFWRNASEDHFYMPYKEHSSVNDFKQFKAKPKTLFLKDLNNIKN